MWILWLACGAPGVAPTDTDIVQALAPDGWARSGCSEVRSEGVATTACTLRREDHVAVVTALTYDRAADAGRHWAASDSAGWRVGRVVVQADVFDLADARRRLDTLPEVLPASYVCAGGVCRGQDGARQVVVGPSRSGRPAAGYVAEGGRTVAVLDPALAGQVVAAVKAKVESAGP